NTCGKKPYECKLANFKSQLTVHQRSHTVAALCIGKVMQVINHMNEVFLNKSDFTSCQRIHTGEKPYEYEECESLHPHVIPHIGGKLYEYKERRTAFYFAMPQKFLRQDPSWM
ncbi:hypothetical protein U0070_008280, partial [Myodes glareolus]